MDKRRWIYLVVLLGLLITANYFKGINWSGASSEVIEDLRNNAITYTRHAECRMECRNISRQEVKEALAQGKVNHEKSDPNDAPCPTFAIEDVTEDGQTVRIIFAACADEARVVTAIDLKKRYECNCE